MKKKKKIKKEDKNKEDKVLFNEANLMKQN